MCEFKFKFEFVCLEFELELERKRRRKRKKTPAQPSSSPNPRAQLLPLSAAQSSNQTQAGPNSVSLCSSLSPTHAVAHPSPARFDPRTANFGQVRRGLARRRRRSSSARPSAATTRAKPSWPQDPDRTGQVNPGPESNQIGNGQRCRFCF